MEIEQLLAEAMELGEEARWQEMAELLATGLRDAPDDPYLLCWAGVAERELGRDGVAYEYFKRCWREDPLDPHILAICGAGLAAFDDPDAEAALRAAALTGPDVPIARLHYGGYLARHGLFDQALENLNAARELDPDDPTVYGELGIAYALNNDFRNAVTAMEGALERAEDDSWTRIMLGLTQLQLGELEDAGEQLLRAANERPDDAEAQILAALTAAALGWDDAAQNALARAEFAAEAVDADLLEQARETIDDGAEAARTFLEEDVAPDALRDRMTQPI